jgi:hypothetical protein
MPRYGGATQPTRLHQATPEGANNSPQQHERLLQATPAIERTAAQGFGWQGIAVVPCYRERVDGWKGARHIDWRRQRLKWLVAVNDSQRRRAFAPPSESKTRLATALLETLQQGGRGQIQRTFCQRLKSDCAGSRQHDGPQGGLGISSGWRLPCAFQLQQQATG